MEQLYQYTERKLQQADWCSAFSFLQETGHIISVVGGGGKSSLIYALAGTAAAMGRRVLVTTTTHMYRPEQGLVECAEQAEALWEQGFYAVAGSDFPNGKIAPPAEALFQKLKGRAELILIESDGARGRACKVPRAFEPVIREDSDTVIAVMGMSVLGRSIEESCFCPELVAEFLETDMNYVLQPEDLVQILASAKGSRKGVGERAYLVYLNQCDSGEQLAAAGRIARLLTEQGVNKVILGRLREN